MRIRTASSVLRATLASAAVLSVALISGCRQDMQNQPKFVPQRGTTFFPSGRSVRPEVLGAVARNQFDGDEYYNTGLIDGKEQNAMPFPVTLTVLERGQERYNIYCTPCHSRVGNGRGMIVERGYKPAGNFHDPLIAAKPLSHYFFVMTHGYGSMPDYSAQITTQDRWAIAAYIRALQLSQDAPLADVPAGVQVQKLSEVSEQAGFAPTFVDDWTLPQMTNVPSAGEMQTTGKAKASAQPGKAAAPAKNSAKDR